MKEASEEVEASGCYVPLDRCGGKEKRVMGVSGQTLKDDWKESRRGAAPCAPSTGRLMGYSGVGAKRLPWTVGCGWSELVRKHVPLAQCTEAAAGF